MAKTATVNRPRKRRRKKAKRRRRNPTSYGAAKRTTTRRRNRRKPATRAAYSAGGYRRRPTSNPGLLDFDEYMRVIPPATLGVVAGRFSVKLGGEFEDGEPGLKHAVAGVIGVNIGANMIGNFFKDSRADEYAYAAGLGYLGELFLRKRFLSDSKWYVDNVSLEGDYESGPSMHGETYDQYMEGLGTHDAGDVLELPSGQVVQVLAGMGQEQFTTAQGHRWVRTATGWQMAGNGGGYNRAMAEPAASLPGGTFGGFSSYSALERGLGVVAPDPVHSQSAPLDGFANQSPLGDAYGANNSFGYARR
jgi:hypothetical protein